MNRIVEVLGLLALACWCVQPAAAKETGPPCHHPDLNHAAFLEGEWRVSVRERTGSEEDGWRERSGSSVLGWRVGGCVLVEELSLGDDPKSHLAAAVGMPDQGTETVEALADEMERTNVLGRSIA